MYNETYEELLIQRKASPLFSVLRYVAIAVTIFFALIGLMGYLVFLIGAVVCGVGAYVAHLYSNLEFEYLYVDKQLSVDRIMAKSSRKKVAEYDLNRMEILAPVTSWHLDEYKNRNYKTVDFSSGVVEQPDKRYVMYFNGEQKLIFEPDAKMVKAIQMIAPRKVFTD